MSIIRFTLAARSRALPMLRIRRPSPMESPIGARGSRLAYGSWKTICMRRRYGLRSPPVIR